jgi:hypothetical protein
VFSLDIRIEIEACHESTDLELVCTEEQYAFLREIAKATKVVSDYNCMPIIHVYNRESEEDEDVTSSSENLKFVEGVDEDGDEFSYYELDTTKL